METLIILEGNIENNAANPNYGINTTKEHDYCIPTTEIRVSNEDLEKNKSVTRKFAKCETCRKSRTKVELPKSVLHLTTSKNDGKTCDFCGDVMEKMSPILLPNKFEGRRGSRGDKNQDIGRKDKKYVSCTKCGKIVLKESLSKHTQDVHEKSNKRVCQICKKSLSGPFSLKEHIRAIHEKLMKHQCIHCGKGFSHFSNMNRHIRLIHEKLVIPTKYVNCPQCQKFVQATSLKKHIKSIHEKARDHVCSFCSKRFSQSYTLKEHIASKHTKQYDHKCGTCNRQFAHRTNYTRHMKSVHKGADYVQVEEEGEDEYDDENL